MNYHQWRKFVEETRREEEEHRRTYIGPAYPSLSIGVSDRLSMKLHVRVEELEKVVEDLSSALSLLLPQAPLPAPAQSPPSVGKK